MIQPHKKISPFEIEQFLNGNNAILTLVFDDKKIVKDMVEKFKDEILGLNLKIKGDLIVQKKKEDIKVHELPGSSSFDSIQTKTKWAAFKYPPKLYRELGTISANDDTIILNINHAVCDGNYIAGIARHIADMSSKPKTYIPSTFDEEFSEEIKERSTKPPKFYRNDPNNTIFTNFGMKKSENEILYDSIFESKTISNYNIKKHDSNNLTAAIVTGYSLSVSALNDQKEVKNLGGSIVENMRSVLRYKKNNQIKNILKSDFIQEKENNTISDFSCLNDDVNFNDINFGDGLCFESQLIKSSTDPITLNHTNFYTIIPFTTKVSPEMNIDQCYKLLNESRNNRFNNNKMDLFDFRNSIEFTNPKNIDDGIMLCFNNLGPIHVIEPVRDLYLYNQFFHGALNLAIPVLTYNIVDEKRHRDEFHSQVIYQCNGLTLKQTEVLSKSLKLYLQMAESFNTISEIYQELREFQKSLL